jgi:hypothetical protein
VRVVLAISVLLSLCAAMAAPTTPAPSSMAVPDFSGFWVRVGNLWFDPILDDDEGKPVSRLKLNRPDAQDIWAGDFDNPVLQPWAREIVKKNAESEIRLQHVFTADDSCWPSGVPQVVNLLDGIEFLQLKDRIVIIYQRDHQVRWVWLNRDHSANPKLSWYGESVGYFEDETLVVDTIGLKTHDMSVVDPFGTPHTDKLHVVERFGSFRIRSARASTSPCGWMIPARSLPRGRGRQSIGKTAASISFKKSSAPKTTVVSTTAPLLARFPRKGRRRSNIRRRSTVRLI